MQSRSALIAKAQEQDVVNIENPNYLIVAVV